MKKLVFISAFLVSGSGFASGEVEVKVNTMTNAAKSSLIEACGTAKHSAGVKPLMVTLHHADSTYTALSSASGNWCILFRRANWNGNVEVGASTLQDAGSENFERFEIK